MLHRCERARRAGRVWPSAVAFLTALLASPSGAFALPTATVTFQVQSGADDYNETSTGATQQGDSQQDLWVNTNLKHAHRFTNVSIPPGVMIVSASLQLYAVSLLTDNIDGYAVGEATGNAPAYQNVNYEITNAPKTSATVNIHNLPSWTANAFNTVADVGPIVQEIVDRPDYAAGNAIKIFLIGNNTSLKRRTKTYNDQAARAAKLVVTYAPEGCPVGPPTCPTTIEFGPHDTLTSYDSGWTGAGHNGGIFSLESFLTMRVDDCAGTGPCGVCDVSGPIPNTGNHIRSQRCSNNPATMCTDDTACRQQCIGGANDGVPCTSGTACPSGTCPSAGTCQTYFGSPLLINADSAGPSWRLFVTSVVSGDVSGTVNVDTGASSLKIPLTTTVQLAPNDIAPRCVGDDVRNDGARQGTCDSNSMRAGLPCDANGRAQPWLGETSLDCPMFGGVLSTRSLAFVTQDSSLSMTLKDANSPNSPSTASPFCRQTGYTSRHCFCDICNNTTRSACSSNADCVALGATVCGGSTGSGSSSVLNTGVKTQPNACNNVDDCVSGVCTTGPSNNVCLPSAPNLACTTNANCPSTCNGGSRDGEACAAASDCPSGSCVGDTCQAVLLPCFDTGTVGDTVTAAGSISTLGTYDWDTTFTGLGCTPNDPNTSSTLGLPGLTRLELPVHLSAESNPLDVVFANLDGPNRICQNNGSGSFTCSNVDATTYASNGVAIADLDNDGDSDLAFANNGASNTVCLNGGGGSFSCASVDGVAYSTGVAAGDFNGDGIVDLVFARIQTTNRLCTGLGGGSYSCSDVSATTGDSYAVTTGDFNGDNKLDVVFGRSGSHNRVCLGDGVGGFTCSDVSSDNLDSLAVAAADLDADGDVDIVFGNLNNHDRVCLNNGTGSFTCSDVSSDTFATKGVAIADVNFDKKPDAIFANYYAQKDRVCLGNGSGSFTCSDAGSDVFAGSAIVIGDFDHDCTPDFVVANANPTSSEKSRLCLGNGAAAFTCQNVSNDVYETRGVAVGSF